MRVSSKSDKNKHTSDINYYEIIPNTSKSGKIYYNLQKNSRLKNKKDLNEYI